MNDIIEYIINNTIADFNIPYCITVNIATYIIIKKLEHNGVKLVLNIWSKRVIFSIISIITAIVYINDGIAFRTIFNSFVLAPVAWSWIFKPICSKLNIDYNKYVIRK